jgi:hypothetical protein
MITTLENLPNEIIVNIVEYVSSPADAYRAFIGLNRRFDNILRRVRLCIDVFWEDKQYLTLSRCFASYCDRLRVFNVCQSITLIRFSRLRSLTMTEPTDAQINSIRSTGLPMLEYLATPASLVSSSIDTLLSFPSYLSNDLKIDKTYHNIYSCHLIYKVI